MHFRQRASNKNIFGSFIVELLLLYARSNKMPHCRFEVGWGREWAGTKIADGNDSFINHCKGRIQR